MMTEQAARRLCRKHYEPTHAGWLLASLAPQNRAKGQRLIDRMGLEDSEIAITYRDYCLGLYAEASHRAAHRIMIGAEAHPRIKAAKAEAADKAAHAAVDQVSGFVEAHPKIKAGKAAPK